MVNIRKSSSILLRFEFATGGFGAMGGERLPPSHQAHRQSRGSLHGERRQQSEAPRGNSDEAAAMADCRTFVRLAQNGGVSAAQSQHSRVRFAQPAFCGLSGITPKASMLPDSGDAVLGQIHLG